MREMKESGVPWIGAIPKVWGRTILTNVLRGRITDGPHETPSLVDEGIPFISIDSLGRGDRIDFSVVKKFISEEDYRRYSKKTIIEKGDILFTKAATIGKTAIVDGDGRFMVWSPLAIIKVDETKASNRFIYYLLNCEQLITSVKLIGSMNTQINVGMRELEKTQITVPPFNEQLRIADILDTKCSKIDTILERTRASIEEYKKLKLSVITEAVTKGIRDERTMKDSGVEWIGEIPAEWKLSRVGLHFGIILGKMLCSEPLAEDYTLEKYYCAANVHFTGVDNYDLKTMWFSPSEKEAFLVKKGDLLVVEGGAGAGGSAVVKNLSERIYIQNSIMIVRPKVQSSAVYLRYVLESLVTRGYVDFACNKATIPHFTKDKLGQVPFPLPEAAEQQEIAAYLDEKCAAIDSLIASKEALIAELEAYKKSIIYEYVTGKKEVI